MLRHIVPVPLLLIAFALPAQASVTHGGARLLRCDQSARTASFRGAMKAYGKATTLEMRFGLDARSDAQTQWAASAPPAGFEVWLKANPGVKRYVVDKTIKGLVAGSSYRAIVRLRWRDAAGRVVARAISRTRACTQPDTRAELVPKGVTVGAGPSASTRTYTVLVANNGASDAPPFSVSLQVGTGQAQQQMSDGLAAGDSTQLLFTGPPCAPGSAVVATVDAGAVVDEADETDNTLTVPCNGGRASLD